MSPRNHLDLRRRRAPSARDAVFCALGLLACAPEAPVSAPGSPSISVGDVTPEQLEALYQRRVQPVANVTIEATLWDPNLIALWATSSSQDAGDERAEGDQSARLHDRRVEWTERYVEDQTSFFVVLELANRPPQEEEGQDALINPRTWRFRMSRDDLDEVSPSKIQIISQDRFPTQTGGYHWRLVYSVHFEGGAYAAARTTETANGVQLTLRVFPEAELGKRTPFGRRSNRDGFRLRWWTVPSDG